MSSYRLETTDFNETENILLVSPENYDITAVKMVTVQSAEKEEAPKAAVRAVMP